LAAFNGSRFQLEENTQTIDGIGWILAQEVVYHSCPQVPLVSIFISISLASMLGGAGGI